MTVSFAIVAELYTYQIAKKVQNSKVMYYLVENLMRLERAARVDHWLSACRADIPPAWEQGKFGASEE